MAPSSSGLGRRPLKAEVAGSNPVGATKLLRLRFISAFFLFRGSSTGLSISERGMRLSWVIAEEERIPSIPQARPMPSNVLARLGSPPPFRGPFAVEKLFEHASERQKAPEWLDQNMNAWSRLIMPIASFVARKPVRDRRVRWLPEEGRHRSRHGVKLFWGVSGL